MTLVRGRRMRRLDDGKLGEVILAEGGELRIAFQDRADWLIAGKREKWVPADPEPAPLREEEILAVARFADHYLESIDQHEPFRAWMARSPASPPHDAGLVAVIAEYLRSRQSP